MSTQEQAVDTPQPNPHLWTRDAHLHALTLDRYSLDELNAQEQSQVQEHLDTCTMCQQALSSAQQQDAALTLPPMDFLQAPSLQPEAANAQVIPLRPKPAQPSRRWPAFAAALGAIAAILLALWWMPQDPAPLSDDIRLKGAQNIDNNFTWTVFAKGTDETREVNTGDTVHPGERLGFQVHPRVQGHLLIFGIDELGEKYLCHPQTQGGASRTMSASDGMISLEEAVRLDDVLGKEHLVALYCDQPISLDEAGEVLIKSAHDDLPSERVRSDCAQREVLLYKQVRAHAAPRKADGTQ